MSFGIKAAFYSSFMPCSLCRLFYIFDREEKPVSKPTGKKMSKESKKQKKQNHKNARKALPAIKSVRTVCAVAACKVSRGILHRIGSGGTSLPGKAAMFFEKDLLSTVSGEVDSIVVTGTNGKTTTSAMLESIMKCSGIEAVSNKSGANLLSGVTAELAASADWRGRARRHFAVIECDEGALHQVVPLLRPKVIIVTNLFRDQLDRYGEVMHTREAIRKGIAAVPEAILCLNADDSLTASLAFDLPNPILWFGLDAKAGTSSEAESASSKEGTSFSKEGRSFSKEETCFLNEKTSPSREGTSSSGEKAREETSSSREKVSEAAGKSAINMIGSEDDTFEDFEETGDLEKEAGNPPAETRVKSGPEKNQQIGSQISDARYCICCGAEYEYDFHTYAHLGGFRCPACGFSRREPDVAVTSIDQMDLSGTRVHMRFEKNKSESSTVLIAAPAVYNIYNAAAAACGAQALNIGRKNPVLGRKAIFEALAKTEGSFGRMETFNLGGVRAQMILVKNPAGCNQALEYLCALRKPYSAIFCLNDEDADGHDISWIWDVDYEKLIKECPPRRIYVWGKRAEDLQLRLKYAGAAESDVELVREKETLTGIIRESTVPFFILPNYTTMLPLRDMLRKETGKAEFWKGNT